MFYCKDSNNAKVGGRVFRVWFRCLFGGAPTPTLVSSLVDVAWVAAGRALWCRLIQREEAILGAAHEGGGTVLQIGVALMRRLRRRP